jgi:DNA-binding transcriptional ArsR family regulator
VANAKHALDALGDPTRRTIFEQIARRPSSVTDLAAGLPVSRPAVSQHLRVLKDAGLVTDTAEGTRHIYRIDPRGIGAVRGWLDQQWSDAMASFARYANETTEGPK